nr:MAG TPA: hypothetical protein [Bacteriophage sp.]
MERKLQKALSQLLSVLVFTMVQATNNQKSILLKRLYYHQGNALLLYSLTVNRNYGSLFRNHMEILFLL